jgi:methylisocitrate lyase
MTADLGF